MAHDGCKGAGITEILRDDAMAFMLGKTRDALANLHALVWGECPSLLNDDSSGSADLDLEIRDLLEASPQAPQAACWCEACDLAQGHPMGRTRMSVYPQCGDKRCPRAKRHDSACSAPQAAQPVQPCIACGKTDGHSKACARVRWGIALAPQPKD